MAETLQQRLEAAVAQAETDAGLMHDVVHGGVDETVTTEGGPLDSLAKRLAALETAYAALDAVAACAAERALADAAKVAAQAARDAAVAALATMQDRLIPGEWSNVFPTIDVDGSALDDGDLCYHIDTGNATLTGMYVYSLGVWKQLGGGALLIASLLSEVAALGSAAQATARANIGAASVEDVASAGGIACARGLIVLTAGGDQISSATWIEAVMQDAAGHRKRFGAATGLGLNLATSGAGGLDTGTVANSTWYWRYAIGKADGTMSVIASLSASAPTLPSGYTHYLRLTPIYVTSGGVHLPTRSEGAYTEYLMTSGGSIPTIASGTASYWTAIDISAYAPSTDLKSIRVSLYVSNGCNAGVAPDPYRTTPSGTVPTAPASISTNPAGTHETITADIPLSAPTIYYGCANNANARAFLAGYTVRGL